MLFSIIGTIYGVFYIRVMGIYIYINIYIFYILLIIIPFSDGEMLQDRPGRAVPSIGALVFAPSVCLAETIRPALRIGFGGWSKRDIQRSHRGLKHFYGTKHEVVTYI